jgi:Protein kinase domain
MSLAQTVVAGRYRLLHQLGAGGMGRVWLARDEMLGRDVAVKEVVPPPGLTAGERVQTRLRTLREARTAARLNHPNVVKIYDVLQTEGQPWIVMEYVPSRSLHEVIIEDGPLEPEQAARIGLAILAALAAAHRAGVLHRDVKPGNVLLARDGRVVLTDFGLATFDGGEGALTLPGLVFGSVRYVPPERARDGTATPESDLWSLGATLYAAVEGRSPYARTSAMATLTALATEPPDPPRRAGPLKPVLAGLLRRDPRDRLRPDDVRRMLQRVAAGEGSRARARRRGRRRTVADPGTAVPSIPADPGASPPHDLVLADPVVAMESAVSARPSVPADPGNGPTTVLEPAPAPPPGPAGGPPAPPRAVPALRGRRALLAAVAAGVAAAAVLAVVAALAATERRGHRAGAPAAPRHSVTAAAATVVQPDPVLRDQACPTTGPGRITAASAQRGWYALPAGWVWYRDAAGYRIAAPAGWRVYRGPDGLCFREPGGGRVLGVMTWATADSPLAHVIARERTVVDEVRPDRYQRIRLAPVPYYRAAADWEFRYVNDAGTPMHADARDFLVAPERGYTIVWCTQDFDWDVNQTYLLMILASFATA